MPEVGPFGLVDVALGEQKGTELLQVIGVGRQGMMAQPFFVAYVGEEILTGIHRILRIKKITANWNRQACWQHELTYSDAGDFTRSNLVILTHQPDKSALSL